MTLFDAYLIVDWSANSKPKTGKDSIWIGSLVRGRSAALEVTTENARTRAQAIARIEALLGEHAAAERRVLLGFDFPYGYPAGFAASLNTCHASVAAWQATWTLLTKEIHDDDLNANDRFAVAEKLNLACGMGSGPFWACPKSQIREGLSQKGHDWSGSSLRQYRHAERRLRQNGRRVQEVWKLWTAGSVGSQALVGIPRVSALRGHPSFEPFSTVWPFETGFRGDPLDGQRPAVLHAEIWPGIVDVEKIGGRVRDDLQVETLARHFASLDDRGELANRFDQPEGLDDRAVEECVNEEGWILGA